MQQARAYQQRVFPLAFHIDYWNVLGWPDPFSDRQYTERQHHYARQVRPRQVYTPQMIVNGTRKFVGSDRTTGQAAIVEALEQPAEIGVGLMIRDHSAPNRIVIEWEVSAIPDQSQLHVALVERGIVRDIGAGENAGMRLRHENVVRVFTTVDLKTMGTHAVYLPVPPGVVRQQASVIGYVQHTRTMRILGAASIDVP